MELAILVYIGGILPAINNFLNSGACIAFALIFSGFIMKHWNMSISDYFQQRWVKTCIIMSIIMSVLSMLVPDKKTYYTMIGAYAAQAVGTAVYNSEFANEVTGDVKEIIKNEVKKAAGESKAALEKATKK